MNQHLNIAIVQETRDPYDCKANTQKGLDIVRKAKKQGADLLSETIQAPFIRE